MYISAGYPSPSRWSYPVARRSPAQVVYLRPPAVYIRSGSGWRGLGAADDSERPTVGQAAAVGAASGAMIGAQTAITTGSKLAGGVAGGLSMAAGILAAVPGGQIPAAFLAAAASLVGPIAAQFKGCGVTCQQTTDIANKVATAAGQITAQYWANSVRTASMQLGAVTALQELYSYLIQNCNAIGGQGGAQCVRDRQPGGVWDFQAQQIAPIQNDSAVVPDPVAPGALSTPIFGNVSALDLLLPAGLVAAGLML